MPPRPTVWTGIFDPVDWVIPVSSLRREGAKVRLCDDHQVREKIREIMGS
ncbi:MAG TPA: hypothetical protein VMI06_05355 [Terriglobia bacterium]|nr:hypothetical protein [Terriglobia bacterium]